MKHRAALIHSMACRFLDEYVRTRLNRRDGLKGVPMVWRCDDNNLRLFLLKKLTKIIVGLWLITVDL